MQPVRKQDDYAVTKHTYVCLIRKEPHTDYWADIPDIPGCIARGATAEAALESFDAALCLHIKGLVEDNLTLPPPRTIEQVVASDPGSFVEIYRVEVIDPHLLLSLRFSKLAKPG
ncbi:MAG TPA: type II toxin-antitoxin system HicB family antitoxin [Patescibacteria group bacterium]|nr:type II toxin-antitoxin system HicB family antitoxin [Patescibacteria group bacterium]